MVTSSRRMPPALSIFACTKRKKGLVVDERCIGSQASRVAARPSLILSRLGRHDHPYLDYSQKIRRDSDYAILSCAGVNTIRAALLQVPAFFCAIAWVTMVLSLSHEGSHGSELRFVGQG